MQKQSEQSSQLWHAGVRDADIPAILEALKHFQARSVHQVVGVHNESSIPETYSRLFAYYQVAVLFVDVPQWGLAPRISTDEAAGQKVKMNSQFDTKNLLYWEK